MNETRYYLVEDENGNMVFRKEEPQQSGFGVFLLFLVIFAAIFWLSCGDGKSKLKLPPFNVPETGKNTKSGHEVSVSLDETLQSYVDKKDKIKFRDKGEKVKVLQKALKKLGYYKGKIDGSFGKGTEKAVLAFQKDKKLKQDAVVGKKTMKKLIAELRG